MRRLVVACGLSALTSSVYLISGVSLTKATGAESLFLLTIEGFAALLAGLIIAVLPLKITIGGSERPAMTSFLHSIMVGAALGPFAGAFMGVLAVMSLSGGAPDRNDFWGGMVGVAPMFALAGFIGGATFWFVNPGRPTLWKPITRNLGFPISAAVFALSFLTITVDIWRWAHGQAHPLTLAATLVSASSGAIFALSVGRLARSFRGDQ